MAERDEYTLIVKFTRSKAEDEEIAKRNYPHDTLPAALRWQFIAEMQEAYEMGGISGGFQVLSMEVDGEPYPPSVK
jgi:hypothetical protein